MSPAADDVIELEPTMDVGPRRTAGGDGHRLAPGRDRRGARRESTLASITGETHTLRRHRLAATALLLAAPTPSCWPGTCAYHAAPRPARLGADRLALRPGGDRRRAALEPDPTVRRRGCGSLEFVLFGGLTIIVVVSQYVVNLVDAPSAATRSGWSRS